MASSFSFNNYIGKFQSVLELSAASFPHIPRKVHAGNRLCNRLFLPFALKTRLAPAMLLLTCQSKRRL